jgi:hypothetical protein
MEKSELVVTPDGILKPEFTSHCEWARVVGFIDWTDGKYNQEWRKIKVLDYKYLHNTFEDK